MTVPLIADIHFDHRLALKAARSRQLRPVSIPGTSGAWWKVQEVIKAVNEPGHPPARKGWAAARSNGRCWISMAGLPQSPVESALNAVHALEDEGFTNMKVSLKASDVITIDAYYLFSTQSNYPLHIGIYRSRHRHDRRG